MKYKVAGFVLKPNAPEIKSIFLDIKKKFNSFNIDILIDDNSAKMIGVAGVDFEKMCQRSDFLVSLGGDGTLLSLVRRNYKYSINSAQELKPVCGINAGNLGFLADARINEVEEVLKSNYKKSRSVRSLDLRMMDIIGKGSIQKKVER